MPSRPLRVVLIKPAKYGEDGWVERFRRGFMPNSTLAHLASLTPEQVAGRPCEVVTIDEYVHTHPGYLSHLARRPECRTLLALVGIQSHQLHRALDLAALARSRGIEHCILGGPHVMTCDTSMFHGRGVSFALAEAETVWTSILEDAARGELAPVYGREGRWQPRLDPPPLCPPGGRDLSRYVVRLLGIYPARGCPYACAFCSVVTIAGHAVRSQPVATTLASLRAARAAGARWIIFTSDNFNQYPEARELLEGMIAEDLRLPFFAQCDARIERDPGLVDLMARAGCFQIFVGVESFSRDALRGAHKLHNDPARYAAIVELCRARGITSHFSSILGFPTDTEAAVIDQIASLRAVAPDVASFYLLTPIPGTPQYHDLLAAGLICERNLDRFDGTAVTWRHPHLPPNRWRDLLYRAYREFYAVRDVARKAFARLPARTPRQRAALAAVIGYPVQARLAAARREHPMAGGLGRVRLDRVEDYLPLRRATFGIDEAPLPANLPLAPADAEINRLARVQPA